jgi:hypothetical protein
MRNQEILVMAFELDIYSSINKILNNSLFEK